MYNKHIDIQEVATFCETLNDNTKIYIGCDSERLQHNDVWYADYITDVVVHVNCNDGCKIFRQGARLRRSIWCNEAIPFLINDLVHFEIFFCIHIFYRFYRARLTLYIGYLISIPFVSR